ncbi:unnamed protein product [Adineta steineri]|uniref:c-SKI SMAD4-binding domain-containing protein n=1 Tax=Adineta steineri TaxID=433720 RepID=A0A815RA94_9BILA|nr:unnamed protein product [Adineta steineri]
MITTDLTDQALLVVLDDDDFDDDDDNDDIFDLKTCTSNILLNQKEAPINLPDEISLNENQSRIENEIDNPSNNSSINLKSPVYLSQKSHQQRRKKTASKNKNICAPPIRKRRSKATQNITSILSYISFDNTPNILTISRMGSIYYCVEDLYRKVFSSLCLFNHFIDSLMKPQILILKDVTLSEKMSIEQHDSKIKKFNRTRYRLLSINSTDYLTKLKQLLLTYKKEKHIDKIINELKYFRPVSMCNQSQSKSTSSSKRRLSTDDDNNQKCKALKTTHSKTFTSSNDHVSKNIVQSNETTSEIITESTLENKNTKCHGEQNENIWSYLFSSRENLLNKSETCLSPPIENILFKAPVMNLSDINAIDLTTHEDALSVASPVSSTNAISRSNSFVSDKEDNEMLSTRLNSLSSMKFFTNDNIMLKSPSIVPEKTTDTNDINCTMPIIVNVEENIETDNRKGFQKYVNNRQNILSPEQLSPHNATSNIATKLSSSIHSNQPSRIYIKTRKPSHDVCCQESYPLSVPSYNNSNELYRIDHDTQSKLLHKGSSITLLPIRNPLRHDSSTTDQSIPYCSCCSSHKQISCKSCISEKCLLKARAFIPISYNERMSHPQYTSSDSPKYDYEPRILYEKVSSSFNRKRYRMGSHPYQSTETSTTPISQSYSRTQNLLNNDTPHKIDHYHPVQSVSIQQSSVLNNQIDTTNEITLQNMCTGSIALTQAIIEHNDCDMDRLPKLLVRYKKTYLHKTVDTMGQLFPTWFNEPDYRCIHCFTCDQVFTPQHFMIHTDDRQFINEQPINITSIELVPSEQLSKTKVDLWNQFCSDLTYYTSKLANEEKKDKYKNALKGIQNKMNNILAAIHIKY